jgi:hypothetical protein
MDKSTETALYKIQDLVQNEGLSIKEATEKVEHDLNIDKGEFYDEETGETIGDIEHANDAQIKNLLR